LHGNFLDITAVNFSEIFCEFFLATISRCGHVLSFRLANRIDILTVNDQLLEALRFLIQPWMIVVLYFIHFEGWTRLGDPAIWPGVPIVENGKHILPNNFVVSL